MALWDLLGKRSGKSLREMLGGERRQVAVGVSVGLQDRPRALVKNGGQIRGKRLRPRQDQDQARPRCGRYRRPQGLPQLRLQVDANSAFTLETAKSLKPLDDLDLLLIEQPLFEDDIWDHRKLQEQFRTPICLDESIVSPRHARYALEMKACRVINIKAGRVGGLSQALASP